MKRIIGHVLGFILKRIGLLKSKYVYRLKKQKKDVRDFLFIPDNTASIPQSVDLRNVVFPVFNQGHLGSCTSNAISAAIRFVLMVLGIATFTPSRLFIYYNERDMEGSVNSDSGAMIRDGIKSVNNLGVCPEAMDDGSTPDYLWPYSDDSTTFKTKPKDVCYKNALLHKAVTYASVRLDRNTILSTLAAGHPIIFGFRVHQSFENDACMKTGVMPVPGWFDPVLGGHAVLAVGYMLNKPMGTQKVTDWVIVRNSWGTGVQDKGYFYMPLDEVMCKDASDAWIITLMSK